MLQGKTFIFMAMTDLHLPQEQENESGPDHKQKGLFMAKKKKKKQVILKMEFCSYFYDYDMSLQSDSSQNIPWNNRNNLWCINHKVIEEQVLKNVELQLGT